MKPKGKGAYAKFSYVTGRKYILNLPSTRVRAFCAAVTSGQVTQPAAVRHWVSSIQYGSWQVFFFFIPAPAGFDLKYSVRLFSGWFFSSEVF